MGFLLCDLCVSVVQTLSMPSVSSVVFEFLVFRAFRTTNLSNLRAARRFFRSRFLSLLDIGEYDYTHGWRGNPTDGSPDALFLMFIRGIAMPSVGPSSVLCASVV